MKVYKIYLQTEINGKKKFITADKCKSRADAVLTAKIMGWQKFYVGKLCTSHESDEYNVNHRKLVRSPTILDFKTIGTADDLFFRTLNQYLNQSNIHS